MISRASRSRPASRAVQCLPALAIAVGALVAAGCSGLTNPKSSTKVVTDTLVAWAINGTGSTRPSAFYLAEDRVVRVTSALAFDFAFDVDSTTSQAVIIPVRLMTDGSVSALHVGLQRLTQSFDSTNYGLRSGYQFDSVYTLSPGQGMLMVSNPPGCATDPNPTLYGKFVIDSVNKVARTIHFRATEDPNCGYRSFAPGIPSF
jgi:hypothetical protein